MKEYNSMPQFVGRIIDEHFPLRKHFRKKRWVIATSRGTHKQQANRNECTEAAYHRIIKAVKTHYLRQGEVFFERDYKHHETENFLTMHTLMSPSIYLYLECDFCYDYQVEYSFNNCPFEAEIRAMLKPFPLDTQAKPKQFPSDFKTFYDTVLRIQEPQYIHTYKGTTP